MKKKIMELLIIFQAMFLFCDEVDYSFVKSAINQYFETLPYGKNWTLARSSVLHEKGKNFDLYERDKAFDNNIETAWAEGISGNGCNEYIMTNILIKNNDEKLYENINYQESIEKGGIKVSLSLNNGFCKNQNVFLNNNRIKKAKVIFYDTPISIGQNSVKIKDTPEIIFTEELELQDTLDEQDFFFILKTREDYIFNSTFLLMQFIILDVYPGSKNDNTCISEINVYGEYINN